jgi:membrane associated rhomboid family serine protease
MIPLRDNAPVRHLPFITWALILVNGVVFVYELTLTDAQMEQFFQLYALIPIRIVREGSFATLVTCMFIHGGWLHIIGNMWTLYLFGDNVEDRMGPGRFLVFYLLCGVAANLTHFVSQPHSAGPTVGASGAIAGVMGAYLILFPRARVLTLIPIFVLFYFVEIPAVVFLGFWFLTQVLHGVLMHGERAAAEGVAWWAHIGGFGAGILTLPLFLSPSRAPERQFPKRSMTFDDEEFLSLER